MANFLPNELVKRLNEQYGFDTESFLKTHDNNEKVTSIRLNPDKPFNSPFDMERVPWSVNGRYLQERPVFTLDPLFHAGCYYVQEASSMFIEHILKSIGLTGSNITALDLCAAPGGKATLVNSCLGPDSLIVANDAIKSRSIILKDNLVRWGNPNVVVSNNDPSAFGRLSGCFDLMLVDAPCSGSGMFRKDSHAVDEWSMANVKLCSERQQRILAQSINCLRQGGYLIYSTCSYSSEENEDILDWLISEYHLESLSIPIDKLWGIEETRSTISGAFGYRFYPHKVKGEGFFISVLRSFNEKYSVSAKKAKPELESAPEHLVANWVKESELFDSFILGDYIHIFPKKHALNLNVFKSVLYLKDAGTTIGRIVGNDLIPSFELAHSTQINEEIQAQEVSLEIALSFLRKQNLSIDDFAGVSFGWCLVRYLGVNLGWVKVLANRVNNYYPKELRIKNL